MFELNWKSLLYQHYIDLIDKLDIQKKKKKEKNYLLLLVITVYQMLVK